MRMVSRTLLALALLAAAGCASSGANRGSGRPTRVAATGLTAMDSGGRPVSQLESGSSLELRLDGLRPATEYEVRLTLDDDPKTLVSYARLTTDRRGAIPQFVLWYQSGVIGCATRRADERRPIKFRSFDEAEKALAGRMLRVVAEPSPDERIERTPRDRFELALPIRPRKSALIYPADKSGCLVNALEAQNGGDLFIAGRNFTPGDTLDVSVVANQRSWFAGDLVTDVTGAGFASAPKRVTVGSDGRFLVRAWDAPNQQRGTYDLIAQKVTGRVADLQHVDVKDIISFGSDTGLILYLLYPPGGPQQDLAGRPLSGFPYFEYADSFADSDDTVWAAVDPTYVPPNHPGGQYAGFIVVNHRTVPGWDPNQGGSNAIADISLNNHVEVMPVKGGCINVSETQIWPAPVPKGEYDVVVDFGAQPANTQAAWQGDGTYDAALDFLDGAIQKGFVVTEDPWAVGATPIGQASYSFDDFFPSMGDPNTGPKNIDLRAVVRYPATASGLNTPVAPGAHPLFVIEHGNHGFCRVCTDNTLYYDRQRQKALGQITVAQFNAICSVYTHATCPDRTKNHEGYMHLLDDLASHGIIAVSIDAYDMTGPVSSWISERADLILKHLEMWSHLDDAAQFPTYPDPFAGLFHNHVDLTKISVSGHSRGGEASVVAYQHNAQLPSPFSINSVSSIAPVDNLGATLPGVPYFVILPAADGDVQDLSGARIYDRAGTTVNGNTTKSGIWVYGANHNFFNTVWAADWDDYSDSHMAWPPRPDFIPAADQQKLGEAHLAAFTRTYLNNETVYEDMQRGRLTFPSTAGRKAYAFRHETQHSTLDAGNGGGGVASGGSVFASVQATTPHQTLVTRLGWPSGTAQYTYTVPPAQRDTTGNEVLSFRVAQTNAASNPAAGNQDFLVELVGGGKTIGTWSGRFFAIPKPYAHPGSIKNVMTTVRIPLHSFIVNNSGLTLDNVDTIRFRFLSPTTGEIYVDDVEFSR